MDYNNLNLNNPGNPWKKNNPRKSVLSALSAFYYIRGASKGVLHSASKGGLHACVSLVTGLCKDRYKSM